MSTNEPPPYPGDSTPGDNPPPAESGESPTSGLPSYGSVPPPESAASPPPPPPPGASGGSDEVFSAPAAIGWGWRKFMENVGPILLAVVVFVAASFLISAIAGVVGGGSPFSTGTEFSIAGILMNIISTAVSIVIGAIIARGALDVVDGGKFDFAAAFGKLNIVNVIIASVLVSILVTIGFILLVLPGVIALFLTYFTTYFVVDDDAESPVKAIGDSVKLVGDNVGSSLVLAILNILVIIAGALALLVGLLVAYPVTILATAYAYRRFRGQPVVA